MSRFTTLLLTCGILSLSTVAQAANPTIIAHRGGTGDGPENTAWVIQKSIDNGAEAIWVTLQLSKDGKIVLYRPSDLASLTSLKGPVSSHSVSDLQQADAAWHYAPPDFPLRGKGVTIPTLDEVLKKWPTTFFYLDIKSPDASPQQFAAALSATLGKYRALNRVRVYSTDAKYLDALPDSIPRFASRDMTRTALANITMHHICTLNDNSKDKAIWYGFELRREVQVIEKFTLGEGISKSVLEWNKEAFDCFKKDRNARVILFGVNNLDDYQQAKKLGADGVLVDSPAKFKGMSLR